MADSSKLNENGNVVANTPYEENVNIPSEAEKEQKNDSNENVENKGTEETPNADANAATNANNSNESKPSEEKEKLPEDPKDDDMQLLYLNKDFVYDCMSVPTHSKKEYRMVTFIILWARTIPLRQRALPNTRMSTGQKNRLTLQREYIWPIQ